VVPQVDAGMSGQSPAGSLPAGTGWQLPCWPAIAQDRQAPQLETVQQAPSVQLPLKHSAPATQAAPFGFRLVQTLARQENPVAQSLSPLQDVRQAAGPQANGAQLAGGWTHAPLPLQLPTGVNVWPLHEAAPQLVVAGAFRQAPLPSQRPVKPQGGLAGQPPCGSIASAGTGLHVPARPATLHDRQLPHVSEAQQTPSTQ
jgi:hypothetical protein